MDSTDRNLKISRKDGVLKIKARLHVDEYLARHVMVVGLFAVVLFILGSWRWTVVTETGFDLKTILFNSPYILIPFAFLCWITAKTLNWVEISADPKILVVRSNPKWRSTVRLPRSAIDFLVVSKTQIPNGKQSPITAYELYARLTDSSLVQLTSPCDKYETVCTLKEELRVALQIPEQIEAF